MCVCVCVNEGEVQCLTATLVAMASSVAARQSSSVPHSRMCNMRDTKISTRGLLKLQNRAKLKQNITEIQEISIEANLDFNSSRAKINVQ